MQLYCCTYTTTTSYLILSGKSDFRMVEKLSIAVYSLPMRMLTSLSVDEIFLLRYVNWSTDFRGLLFNEQVVQILITMHELCSMSLDRDQWFLVPAPVYEEGIRLGQEYLQEWEYIMVKILSKSWVLVRIYATYLLCSAGLFEYDQRNRLNLTMSQ